MKANVSVKPGMQMYDYYTGMFQAGSSIWKQQGLKGLYAGYLFKSTTYSYQSIIFFTLFTNSKGQHIRVALFRNFSSWKILMCNNIG